MRFSLFGERNRLQACLQLCGAICLGVALQLAVYAPSFAQEVPGGCGVLKVGHDYRPDRYKPNSTFPTQRSLANMVEGKHFTPRVEALIKGESTYLAGDISYTLNAFPNHPRALMAMAALAEKEKTTTPAHSGYSVECWFRRAAQFAPDDPMVRMLFSRYLAKTNRLTEADEQLAVAASLAGDNPLTQNNVGLIYFDMKNYEKALIHAHKAYQLGLRIPTLPDRLKSVGKWTEPIQDLSSKPIKDLE